MTHDTSKNLNELTDYIMMLSETLETVNPPDELKEIIQLILEKAGQIIKMYADQLIMIQNQVIDQTKYMEELVPYVEKIRNENDELKRFVEAAKTYPGFQC